MASQDPNKQDPFERLLDNSSEITEFVNSFTSEKVQVRAFAALVGSLGLSEDAIQASPVQPLRVVREPDTDDQGRDSNDEEQPTRTDASDSPRKKRSRSGTKKTYTVPRGLNFAPDGHLSLEQFAAEKQPRTNDEKSLVACYYLSNMMGIEDVAIGHILAVFQAAEWNAPAHPDSALRGCAHRTGWIDTANTKSIKVVWKGENYIVNKMPTEPKKAG